MVSDQDPDYFVSLHSPDGTEIDVGGYERQPIDLIPDPESDAEPQAFINASRIEYPLFDSRVTVGRAGIWRGGEQLADIPLYTDETVETGVIAVFGEGALKVYRDELPSDVTFTAASARHRA